MEMVKMMMSTSHTIKFEMKKVRGNLINLIIPSSSKKNLNLAIWFRELLEKRDVNQKINNSKTITMTTTNSMIR